MRATALVVALIVSLAATPVHADPRDQARQQVKAADIDYRLGRFTEALAEYTRGYELYPLPGLLFNIAQCHKNLGDFAKAIFFYEGYLRDAPAASNRALVEDLIRESKAELAKVPPPVEPVPAAPAPQDPVVAPPLASPPPLAPPIDPPREDPARRGSALVPSLLIGAGVLGVASGATLYYYGNKRGPDQKYVYDDTRTLGIAVLAIGGAAVAAGAILWVRRPSLAPVAAVTPRGAYVGWAGAF